MQKCSSYGILKKWVRFYVERLIHYLILDGYLYEELIYGAEGSLYGHVKLGTNCIPEKVFDYLSLKKNEMHI